MFLSTLEQSHGSNIGSNLGLHLNLANLPFHPLTTSNPTNLANQSEPISPSSNSNLYSNLNIPLNSNSNININSNLNSNSNSNSNVNITTNTMTNSNQTNSNFNLNSNSNLNSNFNSNSNSNSNSEGHHFPSQNPNVNLVPIPILVNLNSNPIRRPTLDQLSSNFKKSSNVKKSSNFVESGTQSPSKNSNKKENLTQRGNSNSKVDPMENFLLKAADPLLSTPDQRISEMLQAKVEAGFLQPFSYAQGYNRLKEFMSNNLSPENQQKILHFMYTFKSSFREVAPSMTDIDLLLAEESFERMVYHYDRIFNAVGVPACLWRRTGEIEKSNQHFASLIDLPIQSFSLRISSSSSTENQNLTIPNPLCIYHLMTEESLVNYWEKYSSVGYFFFFNFFFHFFIFFFFFLNFFFIFLFFFFFF